MCNIIVLAISERGVRILKNSKIKMARKTFVLSQRLHAQTQHQICSL